MFHRKLPLPAPGEDTFFLWGPRQTGKSTLLKERYPEARWLDPKACAALPRNIRSPTRRTQGRLLDSR